MKVSILKQLRRNWSVSARTRITYFFLHPSSETNAFKSEFDGRGHTCSNLQQSQHPHAANYNSLIVVPSSPEQRHRFSHNLTTKRRNIPMICACEMSRLCLEVSRKLDTNSCQKPCVLLPQAPPFLKTRFRD